MHAVSQSSKMVRASFGKPDYEVRTQRNVRIVTSRRRVIASSLLPLADVRILFCVYGLENNGHGDGRRPNNARVRYCCRPYLSQRTCIIRALAIAVFARTFVFKLMARSPRRRFGSSSVSAIISHGYRLRHYFTSFFTGLPSAPEKQLDAFDSSRAYNVRAAAKRCVNRYEPDASEKQKTNPPRKDKRNEIIIVSEQRRAAVTSDGGTMVHGLPSVPRAVRLGKRYVNRADHATALHTLVAYL